VFLELIIDPACSIIFEAEKSEKNVMNRPPRGIDEPFFGPKKIMLGVTQGIGILIISLLVYYLGLKAGYSDNSVRTMTFIVLVMSNIAVIMSNRSWSSNIFSILKTPNSTVKWIVGGAIVFLTVILYVPFFRELFQFEKIGFFELVMCTIAGMLSIVWFEVYKYLMQAKHRII
jgi:Ca2+-transporting ATPase